MSRSVRHTPVGWYALSGPGAIRFIKRYTSSQHRRQVRDLIAQERWEEIDTRRPERAIEGDAKDYRYWMGGAYVPIQSRYSWSAEEEYAWRRKWMRK